MSANGMVGLLLPPTGRLERAAGGDQRDEHARRDGEKIGRSRVVDNCLRGSAHSGFPDQNLLEPDTSIGLLILSLHLSQRSSSAGG
jgi:hypothetical protein